MTVPETPEDQRRDLWERMSAAAGTFQARCIDCGWVYELTRTMRPFDPATRGPVRWEVLYLPCGEHHSFGQTVPEFETVRLLSIGPYPQWIAPLSADEVD